MKLSCSRSQKVLAPNSDFHERAQNHISRPHYDEDNDSCHHITTLAIMAEVTKTPEEVAKENDLLPKLIQHLDRHLIFPLLQFVADQDEEPAPETTKAKYELLKKTNMTDYVATLYCELEGVDEPPKEFATKRQEVLDKLETYAQESEKITDLLGREDVVTSLRSDKVANLEFLKKEHDVRCCNRQEVDFANEE